MYSFLLFDETLTGFVNFSVANFCFTNDLKIKYLLGAMYLFISNIFMASKIICYNNYDK